VSESGVVDLGGCDGCSLGCAVACADGSRDAAAEARRVLAATGIALLLLAGVAAVITTVGWVATLGAAVAALGGGVAALAGVALRAGRPAGDGPARMAFRAVPIGVAGLVAVWCATLVTWLTT
jgi:hypothetical protein